MSRKIIILDIDDDYVQDHTKIMDISYNNLQIIMNELGIDESFLKSVGYIKFGEAKEIIEKEMKLVDETFIKESDFYMCSEHSRIEKASDSNIENFIKKYNMPPFLCLKLDIDSCPELKIKIERVYKKLEKVKEARKKKKKETAIKRARKILDGYGET